MTIADGTDICRITVVAPSRRLDIVLPAYVPFADLFPSIARYAGLDQPEAAAADGSWVLQRLGQEPFTLAMTPVQAGLRDGELVYLRPRRAQLPPPAFDDVADVIATGVKGRAGQWTPAATRATGLGAGAAGLAAGAAVIARSGPPWAVPAVVAAVVALILIGAAAIASRVIGDARAGTVAGYAAAPYAFLAGLLILPSSAHLGQAGATQLLAALAAVALAAVAAGVASASGPLFFGLASAAVLGVIAALLAFSFSIGAAGAAAVVAAPALALTPLIPAACFRLARVALPEVPRDEADLRRDTLAVDGADMLARTASADRFVTGAASAIGLLAAAAEAALALAGGWLSLTMCAALSCVLLLRSRLFRGRAQRLWLLIPGYGGLILLAAGTLHGAGQAAHLLLALGPLLAGAIGVGWAALWLAGHRASPFWGRAADIADTVLIVSLFPLAIGVAGVFGAVRGLNVS